MYRKKVIKHYKRLIKILKTRDFSNNPIYFQVILERMFLMFSILRPDHLVWRRPRLKLKSPVVMTKHYRSM